MAQYAQYNPTAPSPQPVLGWYDTGALSYANLPPSSDLLLLNAEQWAARMTGLWGVDGGTLVAIQPPVPPPSTTMTPLTFMARFTDSETASIHAAAMSNATLFGWMIQCAAAQIIDLTDPRTKAGLDALVAAGLLTQARETAILTP